MSIRLTIYYVTPSHNKNRVFVTNGLSRILGGLGAEIIVHDVIYE
jgi:hypothetical protein